MAKRKIVTRKRPARRPRPDVQLVGVNFQSSCKVYTYKAPASWNIEVGDKVIVDSPNGGYTLVRVVTVQPPTCKTHIFLKWVVSQIDDADYLSRTKHEREERELLIREESRRRIEQRIDELRASLRTL